MRKTSKANSGTGRSSKPRPSAPAEAGNYDHPTATTPLRPDVGTQAQFKKKKPPARYRYDSSLSPALDYDDSNPARELGEALVREILEAKDLSAAQDAAAKLKALSRPFLNWSGKAERLSFDVPTLPLFVHERLSTRAIIETLTGHKKDRQLALFDLFNDPQRPVADQVLKAYEFPEKWSNRMILGDSLVVMNSLLHYEGLGGQVQMIYMDPPYGVKFGSNFQPFVRKRDVSHNDDEDMTREPEMVQAYRDTWELGLHSYLTYLRDRLLLARELLTPSGSIFVQISDENLHHVRELMDEVFGTDNFLSVVSYVTTSGFPTTTISRAGDYVLWYGRDAERTKYRQLFKSKALGDEEAGEYKWLLLPDGSSRSMSAAEASGAVPIPAGARPYRYGPLTSSGATEEGSRPFIFNGKEYRPGANNH